MGANPNLVLVLSLVFTGLFLLFWFSLGATAAWLCGKSKYRAYAPKILKATIYSCLIFAPLHLMLYFHAKDNQFWAQTPWLHRISFPMIALLPLFPGAVLGWFLGKRAENKPAP